MSRTINGRLTGKSASIELREQREELRQRIKASTDKFLLDYGDALVELRALDPEWSNWYDTRPERTTGTMYPVMIARIEELKKQVEPIRSALVIRGEWAEKGLI